MTLRRNVWSCILPLFLSLIIYILFRPQDVAVNKIINLLVPHYSFINEINVSNWVIYSLPGGLWVYSFLSIFMMKNKKGILFSLIPLGGAMAIEVFQYFQLTDGTFDWLDVLFYLLAWTLFMSIWLIRGNRINGFRSSEKISSRELTILIFFFSILVLADVF